MCSFITARRRVQYLCLPCLVISMFFTRGTSWDPEANHPCNIKRFTFESLIKLFGPRGLPPLHHEPLILTKNESRNLHFTDMTSPKNIVSFFGSNFTVVLSSSNSFSEHRRLALLKDYINMSIQSRETSLDQLSNETWYLFGETYTDDWKKLLTLYELPPCIACMSGSVALSFGIGNIGSGVQWHVHGPGFSEAIHGRKHWVLYPSSSPPQFHKDQSSRQWMEHKYSQADPRPFECTCKRMSWNE